MAPQRVCTEGECVTILSRHNPGPYCWAHSHLAKFKAEPLHVRPHVMSDEFIAGLPGSYEIDVDALVERVRATK